MTRRRIRHRLIRCPSCGRLVYTQQPRALIRGAGLRVFLLRRHPDCRNEWVRQEP